MICNGSSTITGRGGRTRTGACGAGSGSDMSAAFDRVSTNSSPESAGSAIDTGGNVASGRGCGATGLGGIAISGSGARGATALGGIAISGSEARGAMGRLMIVSASDGSGNQRSSDKKTMNDDYTVNLIYTGQRNPMKK